MAGGARRALLITAAVTAALYVVPGGDVVARPLVWLATLVHELGHAAATVVVEGEVVSVRVFADGSGVTTGMRPPGRLTTAFVAAGGLIGPALGAAVVFLMARDARRARLAAGVLGITLLITLPFALRGVLAVALGALLGAGLVFVAVRATGAGAQLVLVFLAVQLALSVFSHSDYLLTDTAQTGAGVQVSDSGQIAAALVGPYWLWGAVCGLVSLLVLGGGLLLFLRPSSFEGEQPTLDTWRNPET